jgi:glutamate-ammonia-ligase adenylyltransferase
MLDRVQSAFAAIHGRVPGGRICVLGMGRLGSRELTAGSDLDLLLLYDHDPKAEQSDGAKPLAASLYFLRLTQRLIAAMSAPTGEGVVYELDFRLRPSGKAGPLATHIDAFERYQMTEAWTWERQALTRARAVAGDVELGRRAALIVGKVLRAGVEAAKLRSDIRDMRALIDKEKATPNPFEVKTAKGGFIDVEFLGQYAALALKRRPAGAAATSIPAMLRLGVPQLFSAGDAETLAGAHEAYGRVLQLTRVCMDEPFDPATSPEGLKRMMCLAFDLPTIEAVEAHLRQTEENVRSVFDRVL